MKKKGIGDKLLLSLGYLLFAVVVLIAFDPGIHEDSPAVTTVRDSFDQHFEEFDQVSYILWNHPEYFANLYEKTDVRGLILNTNDALEKGNDAGYLSEEEWDRFKALCDIIQPNEVAMRSHNGINAVEWIFTVKGSNQGLHSLHLYYIRPMDASAPEKERDVIDLAISYFGRYGHLSPIDGKDFWYEATVLPNNELDESLSVIISK